MIRETLHIVTRQEAHRGVAVAFGQALTDGGHSSRCRGDTGHNVPADPCRGYSIQFFVETSKHRAIARFQAHHLGTCQAMLDQQIIDGFLWGGWAEAFFAHIQHDCLTARQF